MRSGRRGRSGGARRMTMKGIAGYLFGRSCWRWLGGVCSRPAFSIATWRSAQEHVAARNYDDVGSDVRHGRALLRVRQPPAVGRQRPAQRRARAQGGARTTGRRDYAAVVPKQTDPVGAVPADNIDAAARRRQRRVSDGPGRSRRTRQTTIAALDAGINAYLVGAEERPAAAKTRPSTTSTSCGCATRSTRARRKPGSDAGRGEPERRRGAPPRRTGNA